MIEGNATISLQMKAGTTKNAIGERIQVWEEVQSIQGWIDFMSGESKHATFNTKIQESTHIFIGDYVPIDNRIKAENCRAIDNKGLIYDVMVLDDPMDLHQQWEIYLKFTGGQ